MATPSADKRHIRQTSMGTGSSPGGGGGSGVVMEADSDVRELRKRQSEMAQAMQNKKKSHKLEDVVNLLLSMHTDLNATRDELQRYISLSDKQLSERLQDAVTKLAVFQQNLEANDRSIVDMHQKTTANADRLHEMAVKTARDVEQSLSDKMKAMQEKMELDMQRQREHLQELSDTMGLTRRQLTAHVAVLRNECRVLMHTNNDLTMQALKSSEQETRDYVLGELTRRAEELSNSQEESNLTFSTRMSEAESFAADLQESVSNLTDQVSRNHAALEDLVGHTSMEFSDRESRLRSDHGTRLDELDVRTNYLTNIIAEVENIPTRRVDWHIKDAAARLAELALRTRAPDAPQSEPPSWTSPIFEAAGAHELQLELQFLRPSEVQREQDQDSLAPRGDCVLSLKADPGLFLVCRLYVGAAFAQVEHTFNAQGEPVCTKPICFIRDQIDKEGALVVGFEVLEAIRRAKRTVPAPKEEGGQDVDVLYHRYLNHRLLDIMQDQVDLIRSGMVRRIEWRLEKASQLRKCFPENECLCSTTFEAAGVDDLQLVFYPSGYLGAKEGFCSFFLHCPAGSMIKCWLSVGKHKREAKCGFEKPGYFGRTNFCRFENSIDPDDTTLLVLEIDEAQWKIEEPMSHLSKVCTVSTKHNSRILEEDSMRSMPPSPDMASIEKVDSKLSRQRLPGGKTLQETRQLPSIWTSVPKADVFEALEGYKTFHDLKAPKRPMSTGTSRKGGVAWKDPHPQPPYSSRNANPHRYVMYAS